MAGITPANRGNKSTNRVGATVSRRLKAAGFTVSPEARKYRYDGLFVSGTADGRVSILVDLGTAGENARVTGEILDELRTWPQIPGNSIVSNTAEEGYVFIRADYVTPVPTAADVVRRAVNLKW